ncbi:MAG TPA: hypothetical protein EYN08_02100 [Gammaproteobacteria bacterium]|nr:hypothetical protein [Gammaproteobacteria bacterium]
MSLKNLFKNKKFLKSTSKDNISDVVESSELIEVIEKDKNTFIPNIDFSRPENFVRYGSAKDYYVDAFTRITDQFPYDGTKREQTEWFVSSSYIDKWVYDNKYPRVNGHVNFSPEGWGAQTSRHGGAGYTLGMPTNKEYILIKGGPNKDPDKDYKKEGSRSNIYDLDKNRTTNLRLSAASGSTVEFWLKVDSLPPNGLAAGSDRFTVFDLWNGVTASSDSYGRFEIYLNNDGVTSNAAFGIHAVSGAAGPEVPTDVSYVGFNAASASATSEGLFTTYTQASLTDSNWHHYAFVLKNSGNDLTSQLFVDGEKKQTITKSSEALNEIEGKMLATLGANVAYPDFIQDPGTADSANGRGLSKFSGSMDEFRYWKTARTEKEIGRYWFDQVAGGTNKYDANVDLGVYYKFNEGILGTATDSTVLDYSGRIGNGSWTITNGMTGNVYRSTDSAIVKSGAAIKEFKDPIIYSSHPDVKSVLADLELSGSTYDDSNISSLYSTLPEWISSEDEDSGEKHLKKLTQIMSSYFDTLQLQIEALPRIKDNIYHSSSTKPYFFNEKILQSFGFDTSEMFYDEDFLENISHRDDSMIFREKLYNIKNTIYNNIYNNLVYINKTKGTEKSFRNLIRCFGIDEEFIKLNMYANNTTYTFEDSYRETSVNQSFVNFSSASHDGVAGTRTSTVYQDLEVGNPNSTSYIYGTKDTTSGKDIYVPITTEAEVLFPGTVSPRAITHVTYPHLSSSLFGCHTAKEDPADLEFESNDYGFQAYAVRKEQDAPDAYFQLTGDFITDINTEVFEDVYDSEKWNFAVRLREEKEPWSNTVSGTSGDNLIAEFYGVNTEAGLIKRSFFVTGNVNASWKEIITSHKRFYVGANRLNFSGPVITPSDVKVSNLRHWVGDITNEEVNAHALDAKNFGTTNPLRGNYLFESGVEGMEIPKMETLALHWDFNNVTSSDDSGHFIVQDASSGSSTDNSYDWVGQITNKQHTGKGYDFPANNKRVVVKNYIPTLKQTIPENIMSSEMVKVLSFDDEIFTTESRPTNFFFAFEKSPYQNISEEMLNIFATIKDFNNLIGEPVNRYRQKYKDLEKIRQMFFKRVENTPDIDKYIDFYKWLDSSISDMLKNLIPASADFAEDVRTVIESHVLERNKYWTKFPTMEFKSQDPEASVKGSSELKYSWKYGHAPATKNEADNCLWWKDRAERDIQAFDGGATGKSFLSSSNEGTNLSKKDLLKVLVTQTSASNPKLAQADGTTYQGSGYAMRKLTRPYTFKAEVLTTNRSSEESKKYTLWKTETAFKDSSKSVSILASSIMSSSNCNDKLIPEELEKHKYSFRASSAGNSSYLAGNGELLAPFSLHSSSVTDGYVKKLSTFATGVIVTNNHVDSYFGEEPLQGPFTEKYVGGQQHRHIDLNTSNGKPLDHHRDRPEAYHIDITSGQIVIKDPSERDGDDAAPRARYFRDEVAKRPVNIRNIKLGTGSYEGGVTILGNYQHNYQVVQIPGRDVNDLWFRSGSTGAGGIDVSNKPSEWISGTVDFRLPDRSKLSDGTRNKTVIAERFSSPGGPETLSRGFLDAETETYSVYNSMNYRNSIVRDFVNSYSSKRCEQFGLLKDAIIDPNGDGDPASWHKVNRNPSYSLRLNAVASLGDGENVAVTASSYDNAFVTHVIPQSDRQYAWITASISDRSSDSIGKSSPFGYSVTQDGMVSSSVDGWHNPFMWVTSSDFGSYVAPGLATRFGINQEYWEGLGQPEIHFNPGNFV